MPCCFRLNKLRPGKKTSPLALCLENEPAISAKLWTSSDNARAFGLCWSTCHPRYDDSENRVHIHLNYHWHSFDAIRSEEQFAFHYGNGGCFATIAPMVQDFHSDIINTKLLNYLIKLIKHT